MDLDIAKQLMLAFGLIEPERPLVAGLDLTGYTVIDDHDIGWTIQINQPVPASSATITIDTAQYRHWDTGTAGAGTITDGTMWVTRNEENTAGGTYGTD